MPIVPINPYLALPVYAYKPYSLVKVLYNAHGLWRKINLMQYNYYMKLFSAAFRL